MFSVPLARPSVDQRVSKMFSAPLHGPPWIQRVLQMFSVPLRGPPWIKGFQDVLRAPSWISPPALAPVASHPENPQILQILIQTTQNAPPKTRPATAAQVSSP